MDRLEKRLVQLLVFLIPSNLALHWYINSAYLNGKLIDYLLPKFYLSDVPALMLILIYLFRILKLHRYKHLLPYVAIPLYLFIRSISTPLPLSSIWYSLKLIELLLLTAYLITYPLKQFLQLIVSPLIAALLFQTSLSLYQFIHQSSFFGYYLLGESNLETSNIAKTVWFGLVEVAPYGTTPHPNVLAGFFTVGILLLLLSTHISPIQKAKKAAFIVAIGLSIVIIILTQSFSAIVGLLGCLLIYLIRNKISTHGLRLLIQMCVLSTLIISPLFLSILFHLHFLIDNPSFVIRYELNHVAIDLWQQSPLHGIGPNIFTYDLPQTTLIGQKTFFLQPPHNIFLLLLTETGLIGIFLVIVTIYRLYSPHRRVALLTSLPLYSLILIGSLDHYPLTLQTGQLLLVFALAISVVGSKSSDSSL